jgi:hypothetical protein
MAVIGSGDLLIEKKKGGNRNEILGTAVHCPALWWCCRGNRAAAVVGTGACREVTAGLTETFSLDKRA